MVGGAAILVAIVLLVAITTPLGNTANGPGTVDPRATAYLIASPPAVGLRVGDAAPEFTVTGGDGSTYQLPYPIGFDGSGKIFHAYKAYGLPTQVFIDPNGVIANVIGAPMDEAGATAQIERILPSSSAPNAAPAASSAP